MYNCKQYSTLLVVFDRREHEGGGSSSKFKTVNPFWDLKISRMLCSRSEWKARYLLLNTEATSKHKMHVSHLFFLFYLKLFSSFICNCFPLLFAIVFHFYLQLYSSFNCNCFPLLFAIVLLFYLQLFFSYKIAILGKISHLAWRKPGLPRVRRWWGSKLSSTSPP